MLRLAIIALLLVAIGARAADPNAAANLFGQRGKDGKGLIAILYDLKQTQDRQPTGMQRNGYPQVIEKFLAGGWDESALDKYFRCTTPLYATQIFIPLIPANAAPVAFGVESVVNPSLWVIHYKGQVSPPEDGAYRFVGYADDLLTVAIDGEIVCIGSRKGCDFPQLWTSPEPARPKVANGTLVYGDWIRLKKDTPVDLDVLVGEQPGGEFCAFLLYQKQGDTYSADASGNPILPVFQLAPAEIPASPANKAPPTSKGLLWKAHR